MKIPEPPTGKPSSKRSPSEGEATPIQPSSGNPIRVLVIDDERHVGRVIETALKLFDLLIDHVVNTSLIEKQLQKQDYQLIILDYVLPGVEPVQVLDWIQKYQTDAGIIVVTGYPTMDGALNCLRAHTFDYITKPFSVEDLRASVLRFLETRGLVRLSEQAFLDKLGTIIRNRRKELGLTLVEAAQRCNISVGFLSQIELGKSSPRIETLYRITLGLQIRLVDLFQSVSPS